MRHPFEAEIFDALASIERDVIDVSRTARVLEIALRANPEVFREPAWEQAWLQMREAAAALLVAIDMFD